MLLKHPKENPAVLDTQDDNYYELAVAYVSIKIVLSLIITISTSQLQPKRESSSTATIKKVFLLFIFISTVKTTTAKSFL